VNASQSRTAKAPGARVAMALTALALLVGGCAHIEEEDAETYQPAHLQPVENSTLKIVTFTALAAEQVQLTTVRATREGRHTVVDHEALIYDGMGKPWVYTMTAPLTYLRAPITVDRVDDGLVKISRGLAPGTEVVTVGASQVYGAELGIAGGH
jgi:hypothetical protein